MLIVMCYSECKRTDKRRSIDTKVLVIVRDVFVVISVMICRGRARVAPDNHFKIHAQYVSINLDNDLKGIKLSLAFLSE